MADGGDAGAVLGIDTATPVVAVAVTRGGEVIAETALDPATGERARHATDLLPAIERAVGAAGGWSSFGLIATGVGPGLFTGLRVGISTARALAQARGLAVTGISSLAALARGVADAPGRPRLALIDARRGELFAALHEPSGTVIWDPFVAPPDVVAERLETLGRSPVAAGDGSLRFRRQLEAAGAEVLPDADPAHRMSARNVCALAAGAPRVTPDRLTPIYLRKPDAELWREQQAESRRGAG